MRTNALISTALLAATLCAAPSFGQVVGGAAADVAGRAAGALDDDRFGARGDAAGGVTGHAAGRFGDEPFGAQGDANASAEASAEY